MTPVVVGFLIGLAAGLCATGAVWRLHVRWCDEHQYRRVRLEATRVDVLYRDKDHNERLARRWEHRAHVARHHIGELTLQLAAARPSRSPVPTYGRYRS